MATLRIVNPRTSATKSSRLVVPLLLGIFVDAQASPPPPSLLTCDFSVCEEHSPGTPDNDCCGWDDQTLCPQGYIKSKVPTSQPGVRWINAPAGFPTDWGGHVCSNTAPYNGNTCCRSIAPSQPPFPPDLAPTPPPPAPPSLPACYDDSACTSPDGRGGTDCWAGSKVQPCSCSHGYAKATGATVQHRGVTYYKYKCCPDGGGEGECGDFDPRLAAANRAYATAVSAILVSLLVWAACCCIGLAVKAWRAWRGPAVAPAQQADTPGSRLPLRRASTLEKMGSLARIQRHGKKSDGPAVRKRSAWMALIHIVPVALVQFLDFSSDVVVLLKMFGPDMSTDPWLNGFVRVVRVIMLTFIACSVVGAWLALAAVLPQQVPRSARGTFTVLVALVLTPINFHVLFVGCLYANLVSRIADEEGVEQADTMYQLFVLLKLAEASIESYTLAQISLMIYGLGATNAPWLLVSSSALSLLSLSYGIFAFLAHKFEAALPSGTRMQLFFCVFLHIMCLLYHSVGGAVMSMSSAGPSRQVWEGQDAMLLVVYSAFVFGGLMASLRIVADKGKRGWLRTAGLCLLTFIFGPMFVIVDVMLVYPMSSPLESSWILSSTYYVRRLWWFIFGIAPVFVSDLGRSLPLFIGVALLDLLVVSPRIFVLTGLHKQSSPWVLYDPCGRLLRRLWPPKKMARPTSLHTETIVEPFQQLAEAGDLSSAKDLRRRACDALEELDKQLADAITPAVKGGMGVLRGGGAWSQGGKRGGQVCCFGPAV